MGRPENAARPSRSAARATLTASMPSDLPRARELLRVSGHQVGRDAQHPLAALDQEPLEGPGHVPAVLQRPDALIVELARPRQQRAEPRAADLDRALAHQLAGRRADAGDRVRALVGVRAEHNHGSRPPQ